MIRALILQTEFKFAGDQETQTNCVYLTKTDMNYNA